jgi:two-component system cell cycle response regulator CtrA
MAKAKAKPKAVPADQDGHTIITFGPIKMNLDTRTVLANGNPTHLTGKEFEMLELLAIKQGETITKEMFLNHLYGGIDEPELKIIDVFICKLRKKIVTATGGQHFIETVWGRGYTLRNPDHAQQKALAAAE